MKCNKKECQCDMKLSYEYGDDGHGHAGTVEKYTCPKCKKIVYGKCVDEFSYGGY